MGKRWQKIVVLLLGFSLMMSFAAGAIFSGGSTPDPRPYLTHYDQQARAFWLSGHSDEPALDETMTASRQAVLDSGFLIVDAGSQSVAEQVEVVDDTVVVTAAVTSSWKLEPKGGGEAVESGSTDRHRLVFDDESGKLLRDEPITEQ